MKPAHIAGLVGLILLSGIALALWWNTPRLVSVAPSDQTTFVPASATLRLTFSKPMQAASVIERLTIDPALEGNYSWEGNTLIFTPVRPWPVGANVHIRLAAGSRAPGWLSLPLGQEVAWSFTVSYPRLVYLYPADGRANLYALDPLTGQRQQITDSAGGIVDFDVNAKGSRVYYSIKNNAGGSDIYRLDLQSNNLAASQETKTPAPDVPKLVLDCAQASCRSPRLSPGEDYLAYERTAEVGSSDPAYPQVWLLPLTADGGRGQGQAIRPGEADHQTLLPSWSPGGLLAFYDTSRSAFVLSDPKQGRQQFFPNQTGQAGYWESDNRHYTAPEISFVDLGSVEASSEMQPVANSHLMRFSWEDGSVQDLSQDENLEDTSPAYAPDGMTLAFARKYLDTSRWSPGRQIWLMRPDGSDARQITNEPLYNHFAFAWDPDGTHLAYVRFNQTIPNEPPEIWILELSSGRAGRWIIGGYSPQWIP